MKDLTQQMLDDYKLYIKESHWKDIKRGMLQEKEQLGPIVNIIDVYSDDGKILLERIYQTKHLLGTPYGRALCAVQVGLSEEGLPFAPIVQ